MTKAGLAKGILAITGIVLFLWAREADQQMIRWVAIGLMFAAFLLRFVERGKRSSPYEEERGARSEE